MVHRTIAAHHTYHHSALCSVGVVFNKLRKMIKVDFVFYFESLLLQKQKKIAFNNARNERQRQHGSQGSSNCSKRLISLSVFTLSCRDLLHMPSHGPISVIISSTVRTRSWITAGSSHQFWAVTDAKSLSRLIVEFALTRKTCQSVTNRCLCAIERALSSGSTVGRNELKTTLNSCSWLRI